LDGAPSLSRDAIEKVVEEGYKENPLQGGDVFRRFFRLVIDALGSQWNHLDTNILKLQRQVFGLWSALEQEEEASLGGGVECPDVGEGDLPVRTQERIMQCSMKS
jgi:hypothetical protein